MRGLGQVESWLLGFFNTQLEDGFGCKWPTSSGDVNTGLSSTELAASEGQNRMFQKLAWVSPASKHNCIEGNPPITVGSVRTPISFLIDLRKVKPVHRSGHANFSVNGAATFFGLDYAVVRWPLDDQSVSERNLS